MLNPAALPLPLTLAAIVLIGLTLVAANAYLAKDADAYDPWAGLSWAKPTPRGRHRLGKVVDPYRPVYAVTPEIFSVPIPDDITTPLDFAWSHPQMEIAGHDDHDTAVLTAVA